MPAGYEILCPCKQYVAAVKKKVVVQELAICAAGELVTWYQGCSLQGQAQIVHYAH